MRTTTPEGAFEARRCRVSGTTSWRAHDLSAANHNLFKLDMAALLSVIDEHIRGQQRGRASACASGLAGVRAGDAFPPDFAGGTRRIGLQRHKYLIKRVKLCCGGRFGLLHECNGGGRTRANFTEFFATENRGWANCRQLPPFGGSSPVSAVCGQTNNGRRILCRRNF